MLCADRRYPLIPFLLMLLLARTTPLPEVKTLGGASLRLKIPPTTQNAQVFRLKGHGMPSTGKPSEHGDLYATVDVQLPKELTPEQRKHFEALQKLEKDAKHSAA